MKRYTTYTRKYKDQTDCKKFGKQFDSMFDNMTGIFDDMSGMFKSFTNFATVSEQDNKTIIKKGDKIITIDKDGNVTIDGKHAVTVDNCHTKTTDDAYNRCYTKTAAECNADMTNVKFPSDAKVHKDLESDMEVISRGELKRVIYENNVKFEKIYWYIGFACVMSCSLAILISSLICK